MAIKSLLPPRAQFVEPVKSAFGSLQPLIHILRQNFSVSTLLLIGAFVQGSLLLLVPRFWVLVPTMLVLFSRFGHTLAVTFKLVPNPQLKGAIHQRTTAVVPDKDGEFNKEGEAAKEKVAILLLALRMNHPLGFFSPGMKNIGMFNGKMSKALEADAPHNGFLGQSEVSTRTAEGSIELVLISYWRSIEDVLKFSQSPSHRETWSWWDHNAGSLKHIGISHEIFEADRSAYENVYINFQPSRMGATSYLRKGDQTIGGVVPDQWVNPLVDASRGKFRNSRGRLGWANEEQKEAMQEKQSFY